MSFLLYFVLNVPCSFKKATKSGTRTVGNFAKRKIPVKSSFGSEVPAGVKNCVFRPQSSRTPCTLSLSKVQYGGSLAALGGWKNLRGAENWNLVLASLQISAGWWDFERRSRWGHDRNPHLFIHFLYHHPKIRIQSRPEKSPRRRQKRFVLAESVRVKLYGADVK